MSVNNSEYWNSRYEAGDFPWDLGKAGRPLMDFVTKCISKEARILIPGAGSAWEAVALKKLGYHKVIVMDWSENAINRFLEIAPDYPKELMLCEDFFQHIGTYDVILEQTFFCALEPGLRESYASQMANLLSEEGVLAGVFFDFPFLEEKGPPWGGSEAEYRKRLEPFFDIVKMERCDRSEPGRENKELFFRVKKRKFSS